MSARCIIRGFACLFHLVDKMTRVDQRLVTLTIPPQEVITRDNVPARVNAVVMFQVMDPLKAILAVENYAVATSQIAQTTLRSLLGRADPRHAAGTPGRPQQRPAHHHRKDDRAVGVEVRVVEIKDVEIPESMQRAMAREAEPSASAAEGHQRPPGAAGLRGVAPSRRDPLEEPGVTAIAAFGNVVGVGRGPELDRGVSTPGRHHHAVSA